MKIRIMGTNEECKLARDYYMGLSKDENVKYVECSGLYQNRGDSTLFRLCVEIEYYSETVPAQNLLR